MALNFSVGFQKQAKECYDAERNNQPSQANNITKEKIL